MTTRSELLQRLADGALHSGADLGRRLGISRAAVSKAIKSLNADGIVVHALASRGYQLDAPLTLLDKRRLASHLRELGVSAKLEILEQIDSTNRYLATQITSVADPNGHVCLAEMQPQGRGRRGKSWIATPYQNLMLSMSWCFAGGPATLAGLSLAAGVAIANALERFGVRDVGLKWPNDVLWRERKLAGLLIDIQGEASGPCTAILGVGVNCRIAAAEAERIDQAWTDIHTITNATPDRNRLAAFLIDELHKMFVDFERTGLSGFRDEWRRRHVHAGKRVRVWQGEMVYDGVAEDIDDNGALWISDGQGQRKLFHSGDVSLRPTS